LVGSCRPYSREALPADSCRRHPGQPFRPDPSIPNLVAAIPCRVAVAWLGRAEHRHSAVTAATCWACRPCWVAENSAAAPACHPCWAAASAAASVAATASVASADEPASVVAPASEAAAASADGPASAAPRAVPSERLVAPWVQLDAPSVPPDDRRHPGLPGHAGHHAQPREKRRAPSRRHMQAIGAFQSPFR